MGVSPRISSYHHYLSFSRNRTFTMLFIPRLPLLLAIIFLGLVCLPQTNTMRLRDLREGDINSEESNNHDIREGDINSEEPNKSRDKSGQPNKTEGSKESMKPEEYKDSGESNKSDDKSGQPNKTKGSQESMTPEESKDSGESNKSGETNINITNNFHF